MNKEIKGKVQEYIDNILLPNEMGGYNTPESIYLNLFDVLELSNNNLFWTPTELNEAILNNKAEFKAMVKHSFLELANE